MSNDIKPTQEQAVAVDLAKRLEPLKLSAFAGAGKTSTLSLIAQALAQKKGIYLAFNKSIAEEAGKKMPTSVQCKTFHSLAFASKGKQFAPRLNLRINGGIVANRLNLRNYDIGTSKRLTGSAQGSMLIRAVQRFCRSLDDEVQSWHIPTDELLGLDKNGMQAVASQLVYDARRLWQLMSDPHGDFPSGHDIYVKLWANDRPRIHSDFILFDEAQDADPLMLRIMQQQSVPIFWVGDRWQQIYSWRGAQNAMEKIETNHHAVLSQSFRFGDPIAGWASKVLRYMSETRPIIGNAAVESDVFHMLSDGVAEPPNAILCRTNATVVKTLLGLIDDERKIAATGVTEAIQFFECCRSLKNGEGGRGALQLFRDWDELVAYSVTPEGSDLGTYLALEKDYGIDTILDLLEGVQDASKRGGADLTISTAHRSKGLQWSSVRLAGDFIMPKEPAEDGKEQPRQPSPEDMRLLYVAMTRAQHKLDLSRLDFRQLLKELSLYGPVPEPAPPAAKQSNDRPEFALE